MSCYKYLDYKKKRYEYLFSSEFDPTKKSLLIFHGLATTAELMREEADFFEPHFNVVVPTLNHVKSSVHWVEVLRQILQEEGIDRVVVKGGSFGGIAAQVFSHQNPESVEGLFLMNTVPSQPEQVAQDKKVLFFMRLFPLKILKKMLLGKVEELFHSENLSESEAEEVAAVKSQMKRILAEQMKRSHLISTFRFLLDFDSNERYLSSPALPPTAKVFLITSDTDPSYSHKEFFEERYKGLELREFPGVGHLLPVLCKNEYRELLLFLA